MSTDLTVTFDSSGYAGVIRQIDTLEAKLKNIGKGSTFGSFDQQLAKAGTKGGADFARNFKSSTNNMGIGSIATRSLTAAGQTAGKVFSSAFKVATTGLAVGGVAAAVGGAAVAGSAIKEAAGQQENLGALASLLGTTREQIPELNQQLKDLAVDPNLVVSFNDAAKATELLLKNGSSYQQILDGQLESTILFQNATGADFGLSADVITDYALQFGVASDETDNLVNKLVGLTQASKFGANDLRLLASQAGSVSKLGVELDDFLIASSLAAETFGSGSDLGTSLKNFISTLPGKSKEARGEIEALGLDFFDAEGSLKSFDEISGELRRVFSGEEFEVQTLIPPTAADIGAVVGSDEAQKKLIKLRKEIALYEKGVKGANLTDDKRAEKIAELTKQQQFYTNELEIWANAESRAVTVTRQLTEEQKILSAQTIFGTDSFRFALDLAATSADDYATTQEKILGTDAAEQAAERSRGLSKALTTLGDTFSQLSADFGEPFLEPLEAGVRSFTDLLSASQPLIQSFSEKIVSGFVAPKVEEFTAFVTRIGPELQAAIAGQAFEIDLFDIFKFGRDEGGSLFSQINIADFFFIDFDKSGISLLEIGDFFSFENLGLTGDSGSGKFINIADFITIDFDAAGVSLLEIGDFFSFENLGLTGDAGSGKFINIADFITFEFGGDNGFTKLQIGDILEFVKGDGGAALNIADYLTLDLNAAGGFQMLKIGDIISFDSTGGQNLLKIGEFVEIDFNPLKTKITTAFNTLLAGEFTFDFSALKTTIQAQFNSFVDFFSADAGANDPSQLGTGQSAFAGLAESLQGQIAGIIPDDFSLPNLDTVTSFFDDLTDIGGIEFALPDLSPIKEFFSNLIGITKSNNSSSFGPSEFSLFPQADDLFSGSGESGDLFSSLLDLRNKAVSSFSELAQGVLSGGAELTEAIDGSKVGELVSGFANTFVSKFDELVSGANITGVAEAAGSLVAAIGSKIGEAANDDGFSLVGSSIANLASNIIGQVGSVFSSEQLAADLGQGVGETVNAAAQIAGSIGVGISTELAKIDTDVLVASIADIGTNVGSALATAAEQIDGADLVSKLSEIGTNLGIFASNVNDTLNERAAEVERNADPQTRLDPFAVSEVGLPGADLSAAAAESKAAADSLASSYSVAADNAGLLSETALGTGAAIGSITSSLQSLNEAAIAGGNNAMDLTSGALPDFFFDSDAIQEQARQSLGASDAVILNAQFQFPEVIETQPGPLAAMYETYADAETQPGPLSADYVEYADAETQPGPLAGGYVTYEAAAAQPGPINGFYRSVKDPPIPKDVKIPFSWQPTNSPTPPAGSSSSGSPTIPNTVGANASGTTFFRGGRTRIAERGPEIVTLPSGAKFLALNNSEMSLPRGTRIQNATDSENELTQREGGRSGVSSPLLRRAANRTARLANSTTGVRTSGNTTLDKSQLISTSSGAALVALNKSKVNLGANTSVLGQLESERALLGGNALSALATSIQDSVTLAELSSQAQAAAALAQAAALADLSSSGGGNNSQSLSESISSGSSSSSDPFGFLDLLDEGLAGFEAELAAFEDEAAAYQEALFASINDFPAFAKGTERFRGGLAWVGENGPELVRFPMGSNARIFPSDNSQRMAALMDNMTSVNSDPSLAERRMRVANYNYHHNVNTVTNDSRQTVTRYGDKRTQNTTIHNYSPDPELHSNRAARRFAGGR